MPVNQRILKILKTDHASMADQVFGFALYCCEPGNYPKALDVEAAKLAKVMTGQSDWNGMQAEWKSYSGLAQRANKWLTKQNATSFRIRESHTNGDGTSIYTIK